MLHPLTDRSWYYVFWCANSTIFAICIIYVPNLHISLAHLSLIYVPVTDILSFNVSFTCCWSLSVHFLKFFCHLFHAARSVYVMCKTCDLSWALVYKTDRMCCFVVCIFVPCTFVNVFVICVSIIDVPDNCMHHWCQHYWCPISLYIQTYSADHLCFSNNIYIYIYIYTHTHTHTDTHTHSDRDTQTPTPMPTPQHKVVLTNYICLQMIINTDVLSLVYL